MDFPKESLINCFNVVQQLIEEKDCERLRYHRRRPWSRFRNVLGNRIGLRFAPDFDLTRLFQYAYGGL